jgi:hypothetical protein
MVTRTVNLCGIGDETWKKFRIKCIEKEISMSKNRIFEGGDIK